MRPTKTALILIIAYTASARAKRIMDDNGVHPRKAEKIREILEKDLLAELTHE